MTERALEPAAPAAGAEIGSVRLEEITKTYGDIRAVDGLTLDVGAGEFLTLLGPSGCGKTTTLRIIGGFEPEDGGRVLIDGQDMGRRPPFRRPVNTVFQQYALFPHLDVAANVGYGLRRRGLGKAELRRRVGEILDLMRIPGVEKRRPAQLSGGQQQRVALARALILDPKVLLLDEPLGALDYKLRQAMQFELRRIHREIGVTFIYVTHDQEEAMTMSDRICVMNAGRIEQLGPPEEVYDRPATRFVAGFVGDTNFLPGRVIERDGDVVTVDLGAFGKARGEAAVPLGEGARVTTSVRPESVRLVSDPASPVVVTESVLVGTHCLANAVAGPTTVTVHVGRHAVPEPGSHVRIEWTEGSVRVFPEDGE